MIDRDSIDDECRRFAETLETVGPDGGSLQRAQLIVMVTGAAPGLGKSTLVRHLAEALDRDALTVTSFPEDEIAARVEFAEVIASFREVGSASLDQLLDASRAYVATSRQQSWDVEVQDMLFPFLPSLYAWGHSDDEISTFFHDLADVCSGFHLLQIHLDADPTLSLPRAINREDDNWLAWMITKVGAYADVIEPVTDLDSLIAYLRHARARTRRLLHNTPWPTTTIATSLSDDVMPEALAAVRTLLT